MVWIFFCRARASSSAFVGQKNVINQTVNTITDNYTFVVYIYDYGRENRYRHSRSIINVLEQMPIL